MPRYLSFVPRRHFVEWRACVAYVFPMLATCAVLVPAHAAIDTVYVDNTKPFPGGPGSSPQNAYASIKTALDATGGPDKVIAVMGTGKDYRDTVKIVFGDSGTNGHPFVLFARGDVTISGADTTTQWYAVDNLWRAKVVGPNAPHQVYALGTRYPEDLTLDALPVGRCRYSGGDSIYINTGGPDPRSQVAYVSQDTPIQLTGLSYAQVIGFKARYSNDDGVTGSGWTECVIANCDVRFSWRQGIMFSGATHAIIRDNVCNDNGSHGIYLVDSDSNCVVLRNTAAGNDDPLFARGGVNGIRVGSRGSALTLPVTTHEDTIEANRTFKNEDTGIEIRHNYVLSRYNQSWDNHDHGFDHLWCMNVTHVGELAWGNWQDGMSFENGSNQLTIKNCVIANNARDPCRNDWEMEFDNSALVNLQSDYNVIWRPIYAQEPADSILINVRGGSVVGCTTVNCTSYPDSCFGTLARFKQAFTSLEQHSKSAQPTFVDTGAGNFMPLGSSSVIDAADTTVTGWATRDVRGFVRHDYSAVGNTGNPAGTFRDIGPYEFDPPPGAPTLTEVAFGNKSVAVAWTNAGEDENVGTAAKYDVLTSIGTPTGPETSQCEAVTGLNGCAQYQVYVTIFEQDNGQTAVSDIVVGSTTCSGGYAMCGEGLRPSVGPSAAGRGAAARGEGDFALDLEPARPNPSPGTSTLSWSIPHEKKGAPYDLSLFDVAGRRVSTLATGAAKAGKFAQVVTFRSPGGVPLGGGIYFLRLRVGEQVIRQKVVVVR